MNGNEGNIFVIVLLLFSCADIISLIDVECGIIGIWETLKGLLIQVKF